MCSCYLLKRSTKQTHGTHSFLKASGTLGEELEALVAVPIDSKEEDLAVGWLGSENFLGCGL